MRVPPPDLLKIDRKALLRDVRHRLGQRLPQYAEGEDDDPTDPAWLLLEQAAWMVEVLSDQLDRYPFAAVQQLVHLLGGQLLPALPAVGAVVVQPATEGRLTLDPARADVWRFFTPQTEVADTIEFVPVESGVDLRQAQFLSVVRLRQGELYRADAPQDEAPLPELVTWVGAPQRSTLFDTESVRFVAMSNNVTTLTKAMEDAVAQFNDKQLGWVQVKVEAISDERVAIVADIRPAGAFARTAPGGVWTGGDLEGDWGNLEGSVWTPSVTLSADPMLPMRLHGRQPMPAVEEGRVLVPDVPADYPVARLFTRRASPMPAQAVEALWSTLANLNADLIPVRPVITRVLGNPDEPVPGEPEWVHKALDSGMWSHLSQGQERTLFHVQLKPRSRLRTVRLALVVPGGESQATPPVEVYAQSDEGWFAPEPLAVKPVWRLPAPMSESGRGMATVVAVDVEVEASFDRLLVSVDGEVLGAMLNALMVANTPAVRDGRTWTVERNIPEPMSMLFEDLVSPEVIERLLEEPIPADAAAILRQLSLAWFPVEGQEPVRGLQGVQVDSSTGQVIFNAPDRLGNTRTLRPGAQVRLDWYRRTDGAAGLVKPGAIQLVEESPDASPKLDAVVNPLRTFFGAPRESAQSAVDRLMAPAGGTPVLPGDFERLARQALGNKGQSWVVRCWTYAERALLSTAIWPPEDGLGPSDAESQRLRRALETAGPDTLVFVVGAAEGELSDEELEWAQDVIGRRIRTLSRRLPAVRDALVTRLRPLVLEVRGDAAVPLLPCWDPAQMSGRLVDHKGRGALPPRAALLLNAAVTDIRRIWQEGP